MSLALLGFQNMLQNSNIFDSSQETVLFTPFGDGKVTQFSDFLPTSVSYLNKDASNDSLTVARVKGLISE